MNEPQTPRDWLLARHEIATPQLDALRRDLITSLAPSLTAREFFAELFRPHRAAWRALAAVWLVLAAFHFAQRRAAPTPRLPSPPPDAVATWLRQQKHHETLAQIYRHH